MDEDADDNRAMIEAAAAQLGITDTVMPDTGMPDTGFGVVSKDLINSMFAPIDMGLLSPLAQRVYNQEDYVREERANPRGRPTKVVVFDDGEWYPEKELVAANKEVRDAVKGTPLSRKGAMLTDEEFTELSRMALPELKLRLVQLALVSDNVRDVLAVVDSMENRVMGKATQAIAVVDPNRDIRRGWVVEVSDKE